MSTHHHVPVRHLLAGVSIGLLVAGQSRVNGDLGVAVNDGVTAAWISFFVGAIALVIIVVSREQSRIGRRRIVDGLRTRTIKWWEIIGGLFGAALVTGQAAAVPVIGVALFSVALVGGSTAGSLIVDRSGLSPGGRKEVTVMRLVSAVIATLGVAIAALGDLTGHNVSAGVVVAIVMVIALIGGASTLQGALNGRLRGAAGDTFVATLINFVVGLGALSIAWLVIHVPSGVAGITAPPMPWENPLIWSGGVIGLIFVAVTAELVKAVGVLVLGLTNVFGQIMGALVMDLLFPVTGSGVGVGLIIGSVVTVLAVFIGAARPRKVSV